jgi:hypothetical protein
MPYVHGIEPVSLLQYICDFPKKYYFTFSNVVSSISEGNTMEENNHGSAGKRGGGKALLRPPSLLSTAGFWIDDVKVFSSNSNICFTILLQSFS